MTCSTINLFLCVGKDLPRAQLALGSGLAQSRPSSFLGHLFQPPFAGPSPGSICRNCHCHAGFKSAGARFSGAAAKASAAMSWRPPLGLRAVVEAIAEQGALEEGEAGPGPQQALFLHEKPSPGFGTNGTLALPLARKRMPLNDGCGVTCPCSAHGTVSCPCGVCHAFCGESHCCSPCADGCGRSQSRA